jgi:hypothetical protein
MACLSNAPAQEAYVYLLEVPDYEWHAGCFGTASGNLAGYWDRNGLPELYTGPTGGGIAPLGSGGGFGSIRALWASQAGLDGRPGDKPGHMEDYWVAYESAAPDPFVTAGRAEHAPDCIGDFIGLSQQRWTNMNDECDGNLDAYSFTYWDTNGARRVDFTPGEAAGTPARDIPSGLRAWARWRGYDADVFSQLTDFNPLVPPGTGFTYEDLKAEINAGYPVLLFLQNFGANSRPVGDISHANPPIHGMLAYGYREDPSFGIRWVYYRTSWGSGATYSQWNGNAWQAGMPVRGVIGFHPRPKLRSVVRAAGTVTLAWDGPASRLRDVVAGTTNAVHRYQVEWSPVLNPSDWHPLGATTEDRTATVPEPASPAAFFRVRVAGP